MKKVIKIIAIILFSILFLLYVVYPVTMGLLATFKFNKEVGNAPTGFDNVELLTVDKIKLKAWYAKPKNGKVIIVVHGATSSRNSVREHIKFLTENGYGVLAFDMRGHGESEGDGAVAFNWDSDKDVKTAVDYLLTQDNVESIGGLGLSLGAEVLVGAASSNKEIKAIVSEGATQRSVKDYLVLPKNRSFVRSYTTRTMYASVKLFSGAKEPMRLIDSIGESKETKFFFIAAGNQEDEIEFNTYFNTLIEDRSKLWIIKNCNHTQGITREKENYINNILDFYNESL